MRNGMPIHHRPRVQVQVRSPERTAESHFPSYITSLNPWPDNHRLRIQNRESKTHMSPATPAHLQPPCIHHQPPKLLHVSPGGVRSARNMSPGPSASPISFFKTDGGGNRDHETFARCGTRKPTQAGVALKPPRARARAGKKEAG